MGTFYKIGFFVLLFLLLAVIAGGAYYFGTLQGKLSATPTPTTTLQPTQEVIDQFETSPTPTVAKKTNIIDLTENIKAAVQSKNYAALEGYMSDKVSVALEATECCGQLSKTDAVKQMDYLNSATSPWNFDQSNDTIKKLKTTSPEGYGPESTIIGIAANEYVAAFKLDPQNKINGIRMAVTYKLILP